MQKYRVVPFYHTNILSISCFYPVANSEVTNIDSSKSVETSRAILAILYETCELNIGWGELNVRFWVIGVV